MQRGDLAIFTADHGCDPTTPSTDHSREYVPLLVFGPKATPRRRSRPARHAERYRPDRGGKFRHAHLEKGTSFLPADLMRKPVMAGNWKMYKTPAETTAFFEKFRPLVEKRRALRDRDLSALHESRRRPSQRVKGSQHRDRRAEYRTGRKEGAFTGEISGPMLQRRRVQAT